MTAQNTRALALRLLRRHGQAVWLCREQGERRAWAGWGLWRPAGKAAFETGTLIETQSKSMLLVLADDADGHDTAFRPAPGDSLKVRDETWTVAAVDAVEPGGIPLVYILYLER